MSVLLTKDQAVASLRAVLEGFEDMDRIIRDVKMEDIITEFDKDLQDRVYEDAEPKPEPLTIEDELREGRY